MFLPLLPPFPPGREAAGCRPQARFGTRGSTLPSGAEQAPPPLLTHFGPRESTSLSGRSTSSRGPPGTYGHEVGCRLFDSGVGVQYPAGGCRRSRTSHNSDRLPLSIPSVGGGQGRRLWAGQEHRRTKRTTRTRRLGYFSWQQIQYLLAPFAPFPLRHLLTLEWHLPVVSRLLLRGRPPELCPFPPPCPSPPPGWRWADSEGEARVAPP